MRVIAKAYIGLFKLAVTLDENTGVSVDQDIGDFRIFHQSLERPETEYFMLDVGHHPFAIGPAKRYRLSHDHIFENAPDLDFNAVHFQTGKLGKIESIDQ